MVRRTLALLGLLLALAGCGAGHREARELRSYVSHMRRAENLNREVVAAAAGLQRASGAATATDAANARALVREYASRMEAAAVADSTCHELSLVAAAYRRGLEEARRLASDSTGTQEQQVRAAAAALQCIEGVTRQHYRALELLWLRTGQAAGPGLQWPR